MNLKYPRFLKTKANLAFGFTRTQVILLAGIVMFLSIIGITGFPLILLIITSLLITRRIGGNFSPFKVTLFKNNHSKMMRVPQNENYRFFYESHK